MSGSPTTTTPTPTIEACYKVRYYYTTVAGMSLVEYICKAVPGLATSATGWQITKFSYDANGNASEQNWANGSDGFTFICDNRAGYSYS